MQRHRHRHLKLAGLAMSPLPQRAELCCSFGSEQIRQVPKRQRQRRQRSTHQSSNSEDPLLQRKGRQTSYIPSCSFHLPTFPSLVNALEETRQWFGPNSNLSSPCTASDSPILDHAARSGNHGVRLITTVTRSCQTAFSIELLAGKGRIGAKPRGHYMKNPMELPHTRQRPHRVLAEQ